MEKNVLLLKRGFRINAQRELYKECIRLIERMLYGNVMIAFHKQDGTFCLERGTLVGYEKILFIENSISQQNKSLLSIGVKNKKDGEDL